MRTYRLNPQGFARVRRRLAQRFDLWALLIVLIGLLQVAAELVQAPPSTPLQLACALLPLLVVLLAIVIFGYLLLGPESRHQEEIWNSIRIELSEHDIVRRETNLPETRLQRQEVTSIQESPWGLRVCTALPSHALLVPRELDASDLDELRAALSAWAPVQPAVQDARERSLEATAVLLVGACILIVAWTPRLIWLVSAGLLGYQGYTVWRLRTAGPYHSYLRRMLLWMGAVALLVVLKLLWRFGVQACLNLVPGSPQP